MTMLNLILLQAQGQTGGGLSGILMIVAMIVIFYFFMIRPQSKQRKKLKEQREALKSGDKIVTAGGIHAVLKDVQDYYVMAEIDKGVVIKISKESVFPYEETPVKAKK